MLDFLISAGLFWGLVAAVAGLDLLRGRRAQRREQRRRSNEHQRDLIEQGRRNNEFQLDLITLAKGSGAPGKDLYFYLRPLELAGTFRFKYVLGSQYDFEQYISFEEALSYALDKPGARYAFCVGDGQEQLGLARIHFEDAQWMQQVVPLFKSALAIISMPGRTPGCLNESYLIYNTPELIQKTVFVIPPLDCYNPTSLKSKLDIERYYDDVIVEHARRIGLHFPKAQNSMGLFVVMDPATGRVRQQVEWQLLRTKRGLLRWVEPVLSRERITAAIGMVLSR